MPCEGHMHYYLQFTAVKETRKAYDVSECVKFLGGRCTCVYARVNQQFKKIKVENISKKKACRLRHAHIHTQNKKASQERSLWKIGRAHV